MFRKLLACLPLLALYACGDKDAACDNGARACDGDVLQECVDGAWQETDCSAEAMICHEMGDDSHCMPDGDMEM